MRNPVSKLPRRAACALACASLVACTTVGPDYERPPAPLPAAWRATLPEAAVVADTTWWRAFGDPQLDALIDVALANNKDLLIAAHRIERYAARLDISRAAAAPEIGYDANRKRVVRSEEQPAVLAPGRQPDYNNYAVGLSVAWEFDVWGRVARANEAARAELLASEDARRAVMLKVVTDLASGYVNLLALDRRLALARETVDNQREALRITDIKREGGSATDIEVVRARAALDEAQSLLPDLERQVAAAENALSALAGRNPGPLPRGRLDDLRLPAVPQGLPSDLLERRPDVLAAEQALVAANAQIGVAKSQYFPTISLTGTLGLVSDQLRWLTARTARAGELGAGLAGVLFSGGRIDGDVREAEARRREMAETYLQAVQTALHEVEDALVARATTGDQAALRARHLQSLEEVARLARVRQEGGRGTALEVLDAERLVLAARERQAQGLREQYAALVAIYKAMGGGWTVEQDRQGSPSKGVPTAAGAARDTAIPQQTAQAKDNETRQ
ncbi:RND transporter [Rubrivivax gelatinosus]|nr:RND transporter [Rubrivivax gelatinosus]